MCEVLIEHGADVNAGSKVRAESRTEAGLEQVAYEHGWDVADGFVSLHVMVAGLCFAATSSCQPRHAAVAALAYSAGC